MARLNEAPAPTESVEALKRRFLRQNRELAKNNSSQSLRISALEHETSRLLAENVALREKTIQLQLQLEGSQGINVTSVTNIRDSLEAKLGELNALVADLGNLKRGSNGIQRTERPENQSEGHPRASKPPKTDMEFDQEGKLPTIDENKCYPRQSLGPDDILGPRLSDQTNESPDIGPPPVAHFECDDPIKFEPRGTQAIRSESADIQEDSTFLPANLETRRKRRESNTRFDSKKLHVFGSSSPEKATHSPAATIALDSQNAKPTLKAGAKRKLSVRDATIPTNESATKVAEDFHYSRKNGLDPETMTTDLTTDLTGSRKAGATFEGGVETQQPEVEARKVLGNKSANLSPRKPNTGITERKKWKEERNPVQPTKIEPEAMSIVRPSTVDLSQDNASSKDTVIKPPKTPAIAELLSPTSTVMSTAGTDTRDTPPPGDLGSARHPGHGNGAAARTARRARSQVNYAEPNLISKMRRPNKDLIDAVVPGERGHEHADTDAGTRLANSDTEKTKMRTVIVKRDNSSVDWKGFPAETDTSAHSPLGQKGPSSSQAMEQVENMNIADNASSAVKMCTKDLTTSALAAANKRRRDRTAMDEGSIENANEKLENLTIYDFNESSPKDIPGDSRLKSSKDSRSKLSRRHVSVQDLPNGIAISENVSLKTRPVESAQRSNRSIQQGSAAMNAANRSFGKGINSKQLEENPPTSTAEVEAGRSVRAARRRSMML